MLRNRPTLLAIGLLAAIAVVAAACDGARAGADAGGAAPAAPAVPTSAAALSATPTNAPGYGTEPPGTRTPRPFAPTSALPDPVGSTLPADLIGRMYNVDPPEVMGSQASVLTLRAADDPHCVALYEGRSTCFTILWTPNYPKQDDPAARGSARIVDGHLALGFSLVPYDKGCEGKTSTYVIESGGATLRGLVPACGYPGFVEH